jgi:hypothetical protein
MNASDTAAVTVPLFTTEHMDEVREAIACMRDCANSETNELALAASLDRAPDSDPDDDDFVLRTTRGFCWTLAGYFRIQHENIPNWLPPSERLDRQITASRLHRCFTTAAAVLAHKDGCVARLNRYGTKVLFRGPTGEHSLTLAVSSPERLAAHWEGFCENAHSRKETPARVE